LPPAAGRPVAVETLNAPGAYVAARRLLREKLSLTPGEARRPGFDLSAFVRQPGQNPVATIRS
jgi:hypothetical protein